MMGLLAVSALLAAIAGVWAQRFMLRRPVAGTLLRLALVFVYTALVGLVCVYCGVAVNMAILAMALLAGIELGITFSDLMTVVWP